MIKLRRMRLAGHITRIGEERNTCRLVVGNPEGKIALGRPKRRWVNNVKMDLGVIEWGGVGWIGLTQDRYKWRTFINAVMNLWVL
jgi:hypothetical protein